MELGKSKKEKQLMQEHMKDMKRMVRYRKKHKKPFWLEFAKELGVQVDLGSKDRRIVGIRPNKSVLKGLF